MSDQTGAVAKVAAADGNHYRSVAPRLVDVDLSLLAPGERHDLDMATDRIRQAIEHGRVAAIEIGDELRRIRDMLPGYFLQWLAAEFGWSERTAYRWMALAERAERQANLSELLDGWGDDMVAERQEVIEAQDRMLATERAWEAEQRPKEQPPIEQRVLTLLKRGDLASFDPSRFASLLDTLKDDKRAEIVRGAGYLVDGIAEALDWNRRTVDAEGGRHAPNE